MAIIKGKTFEINSVNHVHSIICLKCDKTSYSKGDIENLYCGKCGWHDRKDIELVTRERE